MSLLITSSKQPRVGGTIDIGIERPFNYINNFQNPVKIPKNSEIAVESVKINRQPRIQAKDKTILGWFGRRFHQTSGSSVSETSEYVIANVLPIQKDSSSPLEFADQLKDIFNDMYSYHPEFDVTQTVVSVSYTAEGAFNGYLVDMSETAATPATRIPDSVMIIDPNGYDDDAGGIGPDFSQSNPILFGATTLESSSNTKILYDPSSGSITAKSNESVAIIAPEGMWKAGQAEGGGPLSLLNGSCEFVTSGSGSEWWVGLARSHTNHYEVIGDDNVGNFQSFVTTDDGTFGFVNDLPDFYEGGVQLDGFGVTQRNPPDTFVPQFWDYVVHQDGTHIRIYHSVYKDFARGGKLVHKEIKYYEAANSLNSSFATGTPILTGASPTKIKFRAENDKLFIYNQSNSLITGIITVNEDNAECVPKPIDQGCLRMYPKVCFAENASGKTIQIEKWTPRTATTSPKIWGDDWYGRCVRDGLFGQRDPSLVDPDVSTPQKSISPIPQWTGGAKNWPIDMAQRPYLRPEISMQNYGYRGINGSAMTDKEIINIVGTDSPYTETPYGNDGKLDRQPNIGPQVGSRYSSIWPEYEVFHKVGSGSFTASFATAARPATTADRAAYIRVPTLSHQSFNGATGNQSKILFQVPKFDNAGNDTGALQFQANDRLYLDLKNAADINLTDINVQFVGSDEKFSDDLTGQSSVLFHVRPKM
jgi:hypothetical protein